GFGVEVNTSADFGADRGRLNSMSRVASDWRRGTRAARQHLLENRQRFRRRSIPAERARPLTAARAELLSRFLVLEQLEQPSRNVRRIARVAIRGRVPAHLDEWFYPRRETWRSGRHCLERRESKALAKRRLDEHIGAGDTLLQRGELELIGESHAAVERRRRLVD